MKHFHKLLLATFALSLSFLSFAQCPTGIQVNVTNKFPAFDGNGQPICIVGFDVTFNNTFGLGTNEIAAFFYPSGTAQPLPNNTWPACSNLGSYLAGFSINATSNNTSDMLFNEFTATDGVCPNPGPPIKFQDEGEGAQAIIGTQSNSITVTGLTATVPGGCTDPTLSLDVLFFSKTATSANSTVCNFTTTLALPVTYGEIAARILNDKLVVSWETLTENNNDHFEVLASNDGFDWKKIGTINSKASDGNSDSKLSYELSAALPLSLAALSMMMLLLLPAFRSRLMKLGIVTLVIVSCAVACSKNSKEGVDISKGDNVYIKLAQYDKNANSPKYSKIIKAVKE